MNGLLTNNINQQYLQKVLQWYQTIDKQVLEEFQTMMLQCTTEDLNKLIDIHNKSILEEQKQDYIKSVLSCFKYSEVFYNKNTNCLVFSRNLRHICLERIMNDFTDPKEAAKFLCNLIDYCI